MESANIYKALSVDNIQSEQHDLRINAEAVDVQLQWAKNHDAVQNKRPGREDFESFETTYNAACGSIARGELGQAEVLLKRAKGRLAQQWIDIPRSHFVELCKHSEDLTEAEKNAELLPIGVQQVYVLERLGKTRDAKILMEQLKLEEYVFCH